jgi:hypothetical protein
VRLRETAAGRFALRLYAQHRARGSVSVARDERNVGTGDMGALSADARRPAVLTSRPFKASR